MPPSRLRCHPQIAEPVAIDPDGAHSAGMSLQEFMLCLAKALENDRAARGTACRALAHAFPLMTFEPGDGDTIITAKPGPLLKGVGFKITLTKN